MCCLTTPNSFTSNFLSIQIIISTISQDGIKSILFTSTVSRDVYIKQANYDLLFQLVYNLINDAIRYSKGHGTINVTDHYTKGEPFTLFKAYTGVGIREYQLGALFNRFKKYGLTESEGYGLGLSIVKSIAL